MNVCPFSASNTLKYYCYAMKLNKDIVRNIPFSFNDE